jgi:hypothetical protein
MAAIVTTDYYSYSTSCLDWKGWLVQMLCAINKLDADETQQRKDRVLR